MIRHVYYAKSALPMQEGNLLFEAGRSALSVPPQELQHFAVELVSAPVFVFADWHGDIIAHLRQDERR